MILHVLPGDAILETFREAGIAGEIIVCREALADGPVKASSIAEFWRLRDEYLSDAHSDSTVDYKRDVLAELKRLSEAAAGDEVNLWFEHELFCQVNLWFCLSLLESSGANVFRVLPKVSPGHGKWDGFAHAGSGDLLDAFASRVQLGSDDLKTASGLWRAYQSRDNGELLRLSEYSSPSFPYIKEVCEAAVSRDSLPLEVLASIRSDGIYSFNDTFAEFKTRAGVFGYGDEQVKRMLAELDGSN